MCNTNTNGETLTIQNSEDKEDKKEETTAALFS